MDFFRGFVPTKNKKCLQSFKDVDSSDLLTYEQASGLPEYAGILADDTILIDVDDEIQAEKLLRIVEEKNLICRVYKTTKGMHFLFKNKSGDDYLQETCKTKCTLACGLVNIDIKVGHRNSYSVLKYKGQERPIEYDKLEDEDYQAVPKWLLPVRSKIDFNILKSGEGRNQALFNYILTLQSSDFSVDECRECIRIINNYIIPEPLSEEELEVILRDEAFQKPVFFNKRGQFLFDKFAVFLKNNCHIIKINGQLSIYRNGIYEHGAAKIEAEMIRHISNLNRAKRAEVLSHINLQIEDNSKMSNAKFIAFRNGVYNIETDEFTDFSPEYVITNKINYNYVPGAYSESVDKALNRIACNDTTIRQLLNEVIGYTFYRRNELRKAFILIGDKSNGKSTFLDLIKTLLGDDNTTALDLKDLGDRFKTAELFGKLACIGDDIGDEFIANPASFKKLTSGDRITVEKKGQDPFDFNSYAKLLFSANSIPRIKDKSGAVISRLIIIPFNAVFSDTDPDFDPYIKYKLKTDEAMEYLIQVGLEGLKHVLKRQKFTTSEKVQKELKEYEESNNPVLMFFADVNPKIEHEPTKQVYKKYTEFCVSNSFQPMSNIEFSKLVKKKYGMDIAVKTINGKQYRVFVKKE